MSVAGAALLAELLDAVEAETVWGGRSVTYDPVGSVWLKRGRVRRREGREAGLAVTAETMTAETRPDPRLIVGRVLRFSGADWRIDDGEAHGDHVVLTLERFR